MSEAKDDEENPDEQEMPEGRPLTRRELAIEAIRQVREGIRPFAAAGTTGTLAYTALRRFTDLPDETCLAMSAGAAVTVGCAAVQQGPVGEGNRIIQRAKKEWGEKVKVSEQEERNASKNPYDRQ